MSKGVDDIDSMLLPTTIGIILHVQAWHAVSSTVYVEVGTKLLQQGVPVEVGISSTAGETCLMTVVVLKTVTVVSSQSTAGGGRG